MFRFVLVFLICICPFAYSNAQSIRGRVIDIISEAPVMCLVFVEADYLVAVTYNMFYDFDDVLSFSKFFVKEHFSTK